MDLSYERHGHPIIAIVIGILLVTVCSIYLNVHRVAFHGKGDNPPRCTTAGSATPKMSTCAVYAEAQALYYMSIGGLVVGIGGILYGAYGLSTGLGGGFSAGANGLRSYNIM